MTASTTHILSKKNKFVNIFTLVHTSHGPTENMKTNQSEKARFWEQNRENKTAC